MNEKKFKQYFATVLVVLLIFFLLYAVYKFVNGFFGALLLYVVLFPFYNFLINRNWNKKVAAGIVIFVALFVITIPLILVLGLVGNEIFQIFKDPNVIENTSTLISGNLATIFPAVSEAVLAEKFTEFSESVGTVITSLFFNIVASTGTVILNIAIAFFLFYFMLIQGPLYAKLRKIIPFNDAHSRELVEKLKDISKSTVIVGGIIALIQGGLLTIAFLLFGIKGAFLWGFVTAIVSFLPVIGPPVVWIPAVAIQFFQGNYWVGVGLLIFGLFLSNIDNFLRPYLGNSIGKVHPLTTLLGMFVGIPLFGLIGIFVGPLLIAFLILVLKFYKEEYIEL